MPTARVTSTLSNRASRRRWQPYSMPSRTGNRRLERRTTVRPSASVTNRAACPARRESGTSSNRFSVLANLDSSTQTKWPLGLDDDGNDTERGERKRAISRKPRLPAPRRLENVRVECLKVHPVEPVVGIHMGGDQTSAPISSASQSSPVMSLVSEKQLLAKSPSMPLDPALKLEFLPKAPSMVPDSVSKNQFLPGKPDINVFLRAELLASTELGQSILVLLDQPSKVDGCQPVSLLTAQLPPSPPSSTEYITSSPPRHYLMESRKPRSPTNVTAQLPPSPPSSPMSRLLQEILSSVVSDPSKPAIGVGEGACLQENEDESAWPLHESSVMHQFDQAFQNGEAEEEEWDMPSASETYNQFNGVSGHAEDNSTAQNLQVCNLPNEDHSYDNNGDTPYSQAINPPNGVHAHNNDGYHNHTLFPRPVDALNGTRGRNLLNDGAHIFNPFNAYHTCTLSNGACANISPDAGNNNAGSETAPLSQALNPPNRSIHSDNSHMHNPNCPFTLAAICARRVRTSYDRCNAQNANTPSRTSANASGSASHVYGPYKNASNTVPRAHTFPQNQPSHPDHWPPSAWNPSTYRPLPPPPGSNPLGFTIPCDHPADVRSINGHPWSPPSPPPAWARGRPGVRSRLPPAPPASVPSTPGPAPRSYFPQPHHASSALTSALLPPRRFLDSTRHPLVRSPSPIDCFTLGARVHPSWVEVGDMGHELREVLRVEGDWMLVRNLTRYGGEVGQGQRQSQGVDVEEWLGRAGGGSGESVV